MAIFALLSFVLFSLAATALLMNPPVASSSPSEWYTQLTVWRVIVTTVCNLCFTPIRMMTVPSDVGLCAPWIIRTRVPSPFPKPWVIRDSFSIPVYMLGAERFLSNCYHQVWSNVLHFKEVQPVDEGELTSPIRRTSFARASRVAITMAPKWLMRASPTISRSQLFGPRKLFTKTDVIVQP
ncbi:hypothetical protein EVAR_3781_1 [Eumeta japonica]|uniref:Uncharacterized protein n=1 Tax=Eumeta variegata TaxID=151549 RepID=A0A4C1SV23_EUMVA|nr:hypothetical protein EVAR_3781_1 [Eumeta japonica]